MLNFYIISGIVASLMTIYCISIATNRLFSKRNRIAFSTLALAFALIVAYLCSKDYSMMLAQHFGEKMTEIDERLDTLKYNCSHHMPCSPKMIMQLQLDSARTTNLYKQYMNNVLSK